MTTLTTTEAKPHTRHRCPTAARLEQDWREALAGHNPEIIRMTMTDYFIHRNGIPNKIMPCPECRLGGHHGT